MPTNKKNNVPYDAILLSGCIKDQTEIRITFLDGDVLIGVPKWHTPESIGLKDNKVVNRLAIKFWEVA